MRQGLIDSAAGEKLFFSWEFFHAGDKLACVFHGRMVATPSFGIGDGTLRPMSAGFLQLRCLDAEMDALWR
jgi:hypothetical protein